MEFKTAVIPAARYRDAHAQIAWLEKVFGFERHALYEDSDGAVAHAELKFNNGIFMLGSVKDDEYGKGFRSPMELGVETRSVYLVVADANAAYERAVAAGASIVGAIYDTPYGSREFSVKDAEGHTWSAGTYDPWNPPQHP